MNEKLVKFLILAAVVVVLAPLAPRLMPKPASFERTKAAFEAAGYTVNDYNVTAPGQLEAVEQASMTVAGAWVDVYRYDGEGVIAKQIEYQKKDAGSAIVETWNLAQSLGAAPNRNRPSMAKRNGMYMIVATGDDKALLKELVGIFAGL